MISDKEQFYKEIHKNIKKKTFQRQHVYAYENRDIFSADLVDYSMLSKTNKGVHFLLTVIDIYSRYAWVVPLKNKTGSEVLEAFKSIKEIPKNLFVDRGKEFYNKYFIEFNNDNNINMYSTYSEIGGGHIERFNRTLKEKIIKYLDYNHNEKYILELPFIVEKYNKNIHSITKEAPYDVFYGKAIPDQYKFIKGTPKDGRFKEGDFVRVSRNKRLFEKGYSYKFTKEAYKITEKHYPPYPVMYSLEDLKGEKIEGKFYDQEMELTKVPNYKVFEKVLKTKKIGNQTLYLVKYDELDEDKFNEWVTKQQLDILKQRH
jgi:hypothetical protein